MMTRVAAAAAVASFALAAGACDSGVDFSEAPTARAPEEPLVQSSAGGGAGSDRRNMPEGHPPVGGARSKDRGGGARPAESTGSGGGSAPVRSGESGHSELPVDWKVPSDWREVEPSSSMRDAQFEVPGTDGAEPATLAVFHFPGGAGGVKRNIDRWISQFDGAERGSGAETETRTVDGLDVHTVEISGTYSPGMGPGGGEPRENYRLLGAIVETERGAVFFKLVGPQPTVTEAETQFETLVSSLASKS